MKTLFVWLLVGWKTLMGKIPVEKLEEALLESDANGKVMGIKLVPFPKQKAGKAIDGNDIYA